MDQANTPLEVDRQAYWGLMSTSIGSIFPTVSGLFGGYGCPTYPLAKVKGVNTLEIMNQNTSGFDLTIEEIMNTRPFVNADYSTHHRGVWDLKLSSLENCIWLHKVPAEGMVMF